MILFSKMYMLKKHIKKHNVIQKSEGDGKNGLIFKWIL